MIKRFAIALHALVMLGWVFIFPAKAETGLTYVPLGYCQMTSLAASVAITPANCVRASFTATGSAKNLTVSSVTGIVRIGDLVTGTGVPTGTYIESQTSGTTGGAGVYVTNNNTTSSAASLTSGGIPRGATAVLTSVEGAAIRYRDDGGTPTTSVGMPIALGQAVMYAGTIANLRIIQQSASAIVNLNFYR